MYGACGDAQQAHVRLHFPQLVADMEAIVQLIGKSVGTPCCCAWGCAPQHKGKVKPGSSAPSGVAGGCSGTAWGAWADQAQQCECYGDWMRLWTRIVLPLRKSQNGTTNLKPSQPGQQVCIHSMTCPCIA